MIKFCSEEMICKVTEKDELLALAHLRRGLWVLDFRVQLLPESLLRQEENSLLNNLMQKVRDEELTAWLAEDKSEKVEKKANKFELSWDLECSQEAEFMKELVCLSWRKSKKTYELR